MSVSVLIPTYNRITALAATLTALSAQSFHDFHVIVADQGATPAASHPTIQTICRILELHGHPVQLLQNLPRRGMAQQRQFLLEHAKGDYALFLDDDVILEPDALEKMTTAIAQEACGFAGMALIGLGYRHDVRPAEQRIELWDGPVAPETVKPGTPAWERHKLHNAANILHTAEKLHCSNGHLQKYKVAWIGGCVLYDTQKLREVGGFDFWEQLPAAHCGEDVLAQLRLMEKYGGFGLIPSGAYHQELPTTINDRKVNAPVFLEGA
ncbi:glycosyltransferase family 2 protein [Chitinophaga japonensis]|uniref:Glycosyl transferase family 2 n=1 Tax=Chitinophaga japonensis TaxID=104662 RepID=A0A562T2K8_CHIJA|nr:glycosyltransferase family 2 protein [Chitinophaga japonensis]TWI86980.1 glycosyl transferase family 2 [Chitinophaga japonensis]